MIKQMNAWLDMYHGPDGIIMWGIECDEPTMTFDGHYICIFPVANDEEGLDGSQSRAQCVLDYMQGKKQIARV